MVLEKNYPMIVLKQLPLIEDGLAVIEGETIAITEAGRPFVRVVASVFDTYLRQGQQRHSRAI